MFPSPLKSPRSTTFVPVKSSKYSVVGATRFSFGGMPYNPAGVRITDKCVSCGICKKVCSFKAIKEGNPYKVIGERCDDCGSCMIACPVGAINESLTF
ncbi:MAG: ferredoxin [Clostridium sp.]